MACGYFESGCGKSVSNTMWSSPIQRMTSATNGSSHSVEIQQLRRKYSVARHREVGRLGRAGELEVLVDAVQPRRQPAAAGLHVRAAQAREPLEHAVHDHRQDGVLRLVACARRCATR